MQIDMSMVILMLSFLPPFLLCVLDVCMQLGYLYRHGVVRCVEEVLSLKRRGRANLTSPAEDLSDPVRCWHISTRLHTTNTTGGARCGGITRLTGRVGVYYTGRRTDIVSI